MTRLFVICALMLPLPAFAEGFEHPIPQAQSATAEFWFALASIALVAALAVVARIVAKR